MKFARDDVQTTYCGEDPIDKNDPDGAKTAIELTLPTGFSDKAWACWNYFDDTAFLYEYKGHLVVTDESLYLTDHGDGTTAAPFGGPRWVLDSWDELERMLELTYDELAEDGAFGEE